MNPSTNRPWITADDISRSESSSTKMLLALAATRKHVYAGTVGGAEKSHRRSKGKAARIARRAARR